MTSPVHVGGPGLLEGRANDLSEAQQNDTSEAQPNGLSKGQSNSLFEGQPKCHPEGQENLLSEGQVNGLSEGQSNDFPEGSPNDFTEKQANGLSKELPNGLSKGHNRPLIAQSLSSMCTNTTSSSQAQNQISSRVSDQTNGPPPLARSSSPEQFKSTQLPFFPYTDASSSYHDPFEDVETSSLLSNPSVSGEKKVKFAIDYKNSDRFLKFKPFLPIVGILKKPKSASKQSAQPSRAPAPPTSPIIMPDYDSWDSFSSCSDLSSISTKSSGASYGDKDNGETYIPKWRRAEINNNDDVIDDDDEDVIDDDDDTDSLDSQDTVFSDSELDKTQEDIDRERPSIPDEDVCDWPWKIISEEEGEEFRKAERIRREAVGDDTSDLDRPKRQYGFEILRLLSTDPASSSEILKRELEKFLPRPEPVGILKKPNKKTKLSRSEETFYKDLLKEKAKYECHNEESKMEGLPKQLRFDDAVRSDFVKYVQPLPQNAPDIWKYPEEKDPVNPLNISKLIRTYNWTQPPPKYIVVPPTYPDEATGTTSKTSEVNSLPPQKAEKLNNGKEMYKKIREKPKHVKSEELDEEKVWRDVEKCLMSEEKLPSKPKIPKYPRFKQVETAGK